MDTDRLQAVIGKQFCDLVITEAKSPMSMIVAQFLNAMRGEIDDRQRAARCEHTGGFSDDGGRIIGKMQNEMEDSEVETDIVSRQLVHVSLSHLTAPYIERIKPRPGEREHFTRKIDTNALRNPGAE